MFDPAVQAVQIAAEPVGFATQALQGAWQTGAVHTPLASGTNPLATVHSTQMAAVPAAFGPQVWQLATVEQSIAAQEFMLGTGISPPLQAEQTASVPGTPMVLAEHIMQLMLGGLHIGFMH